MKSITSTSNHNSLDTSKNSTTIEWTDCKTFLSRRLYAILPLHAEAFVENVLDTIENFASQEDKDDRGST